MQRLGVLALVSAWGLVQVPGAWAGVLDVQVYPADRTGPGRAEIFFVAYQQEANDLTAVRDGSAWIVRDAGAFLGERNTGCVPLDAHAARCEVPGYVPSLSFGLGDMDDRVRVAGGAADIVQGDEGDDVLEADGNLDGGPGADRLLGGPLGDNLTGGQGADELRGGGGDDSLSGDRRNVLTGAVESLESQPADDVLDGGSGTDTVSYELRRTGVFADLATDVAGGPGEHDTLTSIEGVFGGSGPDVLLGDDGPNVLGGGGGDDALSGRAGDDALTDGNGTDTLDGGDGDDRLASMNTTDRLHGGSGDDALAGGQGTVLDGGVGDDVLSILGTPAVPASVAEAGCGIGEDTVTARYLAGQRLDGCERLWVDGQVPGLARTRVVPRLDLMRGRISLPLSCRLPQATRPACVGSVSVTLRVPGRAGRRLGHRDFRLRDAENSIGDITATVAGRRALRAAGPHPLIEIEIQTQRRARVGGPYVSLLPARARWRVRL